MGTLVFGVASFTTSPSYPVVVARVVMGLGGGVLYVAILRYAANWFRPDEFAIVTGLTIGVFGFGGILSPRRRSHWWSGHYTYVPPILKTAPTWG